MAEDATEEAAPKKSGLVKYLLIGVGVLVLVGASVGGTFFFMQSMAPAPAIAEGEEAEPEPVIVQSDDKAIYHKLRPEFITTFNANSRQRYVQIEVTLVTREADAVDDLITHNPLIRNALVMLFAQQDYLELQTADGKAALKAAAIKSVQDLLMKETGQPGIETVLFTQFVMQ